MNLIQLASVPFLIAVLPGWPGAFGEEEPWNQFRGPGGTGVTTSEAPLPVRMDAEHNLLWRTEVSTAISSPCFFEDRIFMTGFADGEVETLCLDRLTGEVIWRQGVTLERNERFHRINGPASSTPTTDGERVFAYFGSKGLYAYDFEGELLWEREVPFPGNSFGTAASPIIAGDYLVLCIDSDENSSLFAIDRASGETIWETERASFKSGWSTPTLWQHDGVSELLVLGVWWLSSYNLADGSLRWSVPGLTDEPIVTPVTGAGLVFVSSYNMNTNTEVEGIPDFESLLVEHDVDGDGELSRDEAGANKSVLSRADADGEGDHPLRLFFRFLDKDQNNRLNAEEYAHLTGWLGTFEHSNALVAVRPGSGDRPAELAWQHTRGIPECPSPLVYNGRVYLVKNGGTVTCLDAATGELKYQERSGSRGPIYASPVAGDGKIYTASARGVITVLAAGDELKVLASNDLGERIMATPALVDGKVYVRTDDALYAFGSNP